MLAYRMIILLFSFLFCTVAGAKEAPAQILVWPSSGAPVVRFTFGKFKDVGSVGKQHNYTTDTTAENLWSKKISTAEFTLYVFDKNKVRIGDAALSISDVDPGGLIKFQTFLNVSGVIASLELVPRTLPTELQAFLPPKTISITVNSVPQGADVKIDGMAAGTTPKIAQVAPGKHTLTFSKEGLNSGIFPMEIAPDAVSGGSVSYELGTASHDTIELRDGSVVTGDVESMSATDLVVRVGGTLQNFPRNQVKRIALIQRQPE